MNFIGKEIRFYNPVIKTVVNEVLKFDFNARTVNSQPCQLLDTSMAIRQGRLHYKQDISTEGHGQQG